MKKICLFLCPLFVVHLLFSSEQDCGTTSSGSVVLPNGNRPLVYVMIDFKNGRKQVGGNYLEITTDSGLDSVANLNAVGSMGWDRVNQQSPFFKKARKYTYENYWDMIFSNNEYTGTNHPDYVSHNGIRDTLDNENYDLRVWGSIRDYWAEVSYNKWLIVPFKTHGSGQGKYQTGIINNVDSTSVPGKKFVKWIMLNRNKPTTFYSLVSSEIAETLKSMYSRGEIGFNVDDTAFTNNYGRIGVMYAGGHDSVGGWADYLGSTFFYHSEKVTGYSNYSPAIVLCGIANLAHEYGHAIDISHQAAGPYDIMHWGGLGKRINQFSPPHVNPFLKFDREWLTINDTVRVIASRSFSLPPITSAQPKAGIITLYGDAGRDGDWEHSEYFILEYRKREKFNRFVGGVNASFGSDSGGVLIWHRSAYTPYRTDSLIEGGVPSVLSIMVPYYGVNFQGNFGSPSHLYYSGHNSVSQSTTPNSNSNSNLLTGISLSNFSVASGQIAIDAQYTLGSIPNWDYFVTDQTTSLPSSISGSVYIDGQPIFSALTIANGTQIQFSPLARLHVNHLTANATTQNSISLKGTGFSSYRTRWQGVDISSGTDSSLVHNCLIENADIGLHLERPSYRATISNNTFQNCSLSIELKGASAIYGEPFPNLDQNFSSLKIDGGIWQFDNGQDLIIPNGSTCDVIASSFATTIKLGSNSDIYAYGRLSAANHSYPITFTALNGTSPNSWGAIVFDGSGSASSVLDNILMQYGAEIQCRNGANITIQNSTLKDNNQGVYTYYASPTISNNIIQNVHYHGITSDWSSASIQNNTISKDASHYYHANCGIWTYGSSPYIAGNTIQGFGYGLYPTDNSSPHFWTSSGTTPYPNNRIKNNLYGLVTYNSSYVHMGEWNYYTDVYYGNNNGLDSNQYDDIYVFNSSAVYAQNNWWGDDHAPSNWVQSGSFFDWYDPLWQCPWGQNFIAIQKGGEPATVSMSTYNSPAVAQGQNVLPRQRDFRDDLMKAFMLRKLQRYSDAIELYKKLLAGEKSFKPALIELADMFRETNDDAILQFFTGIQSDTKTYPLAVQNRPVIFELLASMCIQKGDYSSAKQLCDNVITQFPGTSDERQSRFQKFYLAMHLEKDKSAATQLLNDITSRYTEGEDVELAKYLFSQENFSSSAKSSSLGTNSSLALSKKLDMAKGPEKFELSANYPNPFNPSTTIRYAIPENNTVTLKVYDVLGKEVATLVKEEKPIGFYEVQFDATQLSSGIYFYEIQAGSFHDVKKMLLLK